MVYFIAASYVKSLVRISTVYFSIVTLLLKVEVATSVVLSSLEWYFMPCTWLDHSIRHPTMEKNMMKKHRTHPPKKKLIFNLKYVHFDGKQSREKTTIKQAQLLALHANISSCTRTCTLTNERAKRTWEEIQLVLAVNESGTVLVKMRKRVCSMASGIHSN